MKAIVALSLLFVTLLISGFVFAANDQPNPPSGRFDQSYVINRSGPYAVFAGPKVGWVKLPVEEATPALGQTTR